MLTYFDFLIFFIFLFSLGTLARFDFLIF